MNLHPVVSTTLTDPLNPESRWNPQFLTFLQDIKDQASTEKLKTDLLAWLQTRCRHPEAVFTRLFQQPDLNPDKAVQILCEHASIANLPEHRPLLLELLRHLAPGACPGATGGDSRGGNPAGVREGGFSRTRRPHTFQRRRKRGMKKRSPSAKRIDAGVHKIVRPVRVLLPEADANQGKADASEWEFPEGLEQVLDEKTGESRVICARLGLEIRRTADGHEYWYQNGQLHRKDGPAVIENGHQFWYQHGQLHRDDGPAIIMASGTKEWHRLGLCHREDGPAVEYSESSYIWYWQGKIHREGGPAVFKAHSGIAEWWTHGTHVRTDFPTNAEEAPRLPLP